MVRLAEDMDLKTLRIGVHLRCHKQLHLVAKEDFVSRLDGKPVP